MINIDKIRGVRNEKRITQEEMANYLDISRVSYNSKETGKTEFLGKELITICNILDLNIDDISM